MAWTLRNGTLPNSWTFGRTFGRIPHDDISFIHSGGCFKAISVMKLPTGDGEKTIHPMCGKIKRTLYGTGFATWNNGCSRTLSLHCYASDMRHESAQIFGIFFGTYPAIQFWGAIIARFEWGFRRARTKWIWHATRLLSICSWNGSLVALPSKILIRKKTRKIRHLSLKMGYRPPKKHGHFDTEHGDEPLLGLWAMAAMAAMARWFSELFRRLELPQTSCLEMRVFSDFHHGNAVFLKKNWGGKIDVGCDHSSSIFQDQS